MGTRKDHITVEEAGLLEAIHADPKNDGLRLVYGDWLEDHGQPELGAFIRAHLLDEHFAYRKPAHLKGGLVVCRGPKPEPSAPEVWDVRAEWYVPLPRPLRFNGFSRGLPHFGYYDKIASVGQWDTVLQRVSPRARLDVCVMEGNALRDHLNHELLSRARALIIYANDPPDPGGYAISADAVSALAEFPHLERLDFVHLMAFVFDDGLKIIRERILDRVTVKPQGWFQA